MSGTVSVVNCRQGAQKQDSSDWFPAIPTTTEKPLAPCTYDCTEPHCTPECSCKYYYDQGVGQGCGEGGGLPLFSSNCQLFYAECGKYG